MATIEGRVGVKLVGVVVTLLIASVRVDDVTESLAEGVAADPDALDGLVVVMVEGSSLGGDCSWSAVAANNSKVTLLLTRVSSMIGI